MNVNVCLSIHINCFDVIRDIYTGNYAIKKKVPTTALHICEVNRTDIDVSKHTEKFLAV